MKNLIQILTLMSICSAFSGTKTAYLDSFTQDQLLFINETLNYQLENCP